MTRTRRCAALLLGLSLPAHAAPAPVETIVLLRHGEKPPGGLGQLDCQGLNRALALPAVIARAFGRPSAIFAPNPAAMKKDGGRDYNYIRPLATIEPTAVSFGMTVDLSFSVQDWQGLGRRLDTPAYARSVVIVAWEHTDLVDLARWLMRAHGGDAAVVPVWDKTDFDSFYVLRLSGGRVAFEHQFERLDGQPSRCPH